MFPARFTTATPFGANPGHPSGTGHASPVQAISYIIPSQQANLDHSTGQPRIEPKFEEDEIPYQEHDSNLTPKEEEYLILYTQQWIQPNMLSDDYAYKPYWVLISKLLFEISKIIAPQQRFLHWKLCRQRMRENVEMHKAWRAAHKHIESRPTGEAGTMEYLFRYWDEQAEAYEGWSDYLRRESTTGLDVLSSPLRPVQVGQKVHLPPARELLCPPVIVHGAQRGQKRPREEDTAPGPVLRRARTVFNHGLNEKDSTDKSHELCRNGPSSIQVQVHAALDKLHVDLVPLFGEKHYTAFTLISDIRKAVKKALAALEDVSSADLAPGTSRA